MSRSGSTLEELARLLREIREIDPQAAAEIERLIAKKVEELTADEAAALIRYLGRFQGLAKLLGRLGGLLGEGFALGAELLGKAFSIQGMIFFEILFNPPGPDEPGGIAIPYKEYTKVATYLVHQSGDVTTCFVVCVYRYTQGFVKGQDPAKGWKVDHGDEIFIVRPYDCSKPPPESILGGLCADKIYAQGEY